MNYVVIAERDTAGFNREINTFAALGYRIVVAQVAVIGQEVQYFAVMGGRPSGRTR